MPIPPVQAAGLLLTAAPLAEAALSAASAAFADLLAAATSNRASGDLPDSAEAGATPFGLEGLSASALGQRTQIASAAGSLRSETNELLRRFHDLLRDLLAEHDIDPAGGFELFVDSAGEIRVAGSHPEAARIESLLAAEPKLRRLFGRIAANANLLRALDEAAAVERSGGLRLIVDPAQTTVEPG